MVISLTLSDAEVAGLAKQAVTPGETPDVTIHRMLVPLVQSVADQQIQALMAQYKDLPLDQQLVVIAQLQALSSGLVTTQASPSTVS